jgi:hypothetical protein
MATASVVLSRPEIWDTVVQHVGQHEWLYLGGVCRSWAALYAGQPRSRRRRQPEATSALRQKSTSHCAAAASLRRALWAYRYHTKKSVKQLSVLQLAKAAAAQGTSEVLVWARAEAAKQWCTWGQELCIAAISGNQLATLRSVRDDAEVQFDTLHLAITAAGAQTADLGMLQWICSQRVGWVSDELIDLCAAAGAIAAIEKLDWLRTFVPGEHWHTAKVCSAIVDTGAVASLEWLTAHGLQWPEAHLGAWSYAEWAFLSLQFEALRYVVQHGCPWRTQGAALVAAAAADVQTLQWIVEADQQPWSAARLSALLIVAGQSDNVPVATWLREQGAEWPRSFLQPAVLVISKDAVVQETLLSNAPLLQHYTNTNDDEEPVVVCWSQSTIQWALANGCPWGEWDSDTCIAVCSQPNILQTPAAQQRITWAHAAGCPCSCRSHHLLARLQHGSSPQALTAPELEWWHAVLFKLYAPTSGQSLLAVVLLWTVIWFVGTLVPFLV